MDTRDEWPPGARVLPVYAAAVLVQCAHLAEEYTAGVHRASRPCWGRSRGAEAGSSPSTSPRWRCSRRAAYLAALFLTLGGGIGNGVEHLARAGGYFPGAYTGALALLVGSILAYGCSETDGPRMTVLHR